MSRIDGVPPRFDAAFGLGQAGFSEGMACARMESGAGDDVPPAVAS